MYNLYKICQFYRQKVNSVYNGTKVSFLVPIKWELNTKWAKRYRKLSTIKKKKKKKKKSKIGHQRNILVGFEKFILAISVLCKIRGRWRIIPVQKNLKYNRVSQWSGLEHFANIVYGFKAITILEVWLVLVLCRYATVMCFVCGALLFIKFSVFRILNWYKFLYRQLMQISMAKFCHNYSFLLYM